MILDFRQYEVEDLEKATHWIPTEEHREKLANVIVGKPCKLLVSDFDDEICINEENGIEAPTYIYHSGYYVSLPNDKEESDIL